MITASSAAEAAEALSDSGFLIHVEGETGLQRLDNVR